MSTVSVRLNDVERDYAEQLAKFKGVNLSDYFRSIIYEQVEDLEDLKAIERYENNPKQKLYTHKEVWSEEVEKI